MASDKIDMNEKRNICTHLYHNHYADYDKNTKYWLYEQLNLAYPKKFLKIDFKYSKIVDIEPFIIILLEIIKEYQSDNLTDYIHTITKTDKDIIEYVLADFYKEGLIISNTKENTYKISPYGLELIEKKQKREIFKDKLYIEYDMLINSISNVYERNSRPTVQRLDKNKDVELQGKSENSFIPGKYNLDREMPDGKIYRTILYEKIKKFYEEQEENQADILVENIDNIEVFNDKTYDFYYTLFFINEDDDEKLLVIDEDNDIEENQTHILNYLQENRLFTLNFKNKKKDNENGVKRQYNQKKESIREISNIGLNTSKNKLIQNEEHPLYLIEAFKNAKSEIHIISPWIRYKILEKYSKYLENALEKNITVYITYGISNGKKEDIDNKAREYLNELEKKYKNLHIRGNSNTHEKILICDDNWAIIGSFNWLSYDGKDDRDETSNLFTDKDNINKLKGKNMDKK